MFSSGFVIICEIDRHTYALGRDGSFGTLPRIEPRVFRSYAAALHKLGTYVRERRPRGSVFNMCRIISARAVGVRR